MLIQTLPNILKNFRNCNFVCAGGKNSTLFTASIYTSEKYSVQYNLKFTLLR